MPALVGCVLAAAVGMQVAFAGHSGESSRLIGLAERIPASLPGWTVSEDPFGPDAASCDYVARTLNFNEYVSRMYRKGPVVVELYCAHWNPGRMPARAVDIHTPDCCWVGSGLRCVDASSSVVLKAPGVSFLPGEKRTFVSAAGETTHVMFWHLVEGQPYKLGVSTHAGPVNAVRAFLADAVEGSREQMFATFSASVPLQELMTDPGFAQLARALADVGFRDGRATLSP